MFLWLKDDTLAPIIMCNELMLTLVALVVTLPHSFCTQPTYCFELENIDLRIYIGLDKGLPGYLSIYQEPILVDARHI